MAYNKKLSSRIDKMLLTRNDFMSIKMFGGVGFLLRGNMCVGVHEDYLICRLGPKQAESALEKKYSKPFDITGRPMKGWVMIENDAVLTKQGLNKWVNTCIKFVDTLPAK